MLRSDHFRNDERQHLNSDQPQYSARHTMSYNQAPVTSQTPNATAMQVGHQDEETKPNVALVNNLSLITILVGFAPLGIVAMIFAYLTQRTVDKPGQLKKAKRYWKLSMGFSIASVVSGFIIVIVSVSVYVYYVSQLY
jgi:uncharacterized membrane protein